jgi:ketosteroid isomerase-like protein
VGGTIVFYDPDATTAGPAMDPARGVAEIREMWKSLFETQGERRLSWSVEKIVIAPSGDLATLAAAWKESGSEAGGPALAVWKKQPDGTWKVLIDAAWALPSAQRASE